jgi:hypothetical protein
LQFSARKLEQGIRVTVLMTEPSLFAFAPVLHHREEFRRRVDIASAEREMEYLLDCVHQSPTGPTSCR